MRTSLLLLLPFMLLLSCKKDRLEHNEYYGTWELRAFTGVEPEVSDKYEPGNGRYVALKKNGTMIRYTDNKVQSTSSFKITKKDISGCSWFGQKDYWALETGNSHIAIKIRNDTLILSTPPCWTDGSISYYVRVR